jgi:hypothetical protein
MKLTVAFGARSCSAVFGRRSKHQNEESSQLACHAGCWGRSTDGGLA